MAKKAVTGFRLEPPEHEALAKAAAHHEWSMSLIVRKAVIAWLVDGGWLPKPAAPARRKK